MVRPAIVAATLALAAVISVADPSAAATAVDAAARASRPVAGDSITTVYVVRHAERNDDFVGTDPPLTEAGARRAIALAHTLADAGITAIYSTHFLRCRDTARPLADSLGDTLRIVDQSNAKALADRVRSECAGGAALVVGHADTVPDIVAAFAQIEVPPFVAGEFDRLYVITLPAHGRARVIRLRYGEPTARAR